MPSISVQSDTGNGTNTPSPKKLKTSCGRSGQAGRLTLKWSITNREDYHPLLLQQPYGVATDGENIVLAEGLWPHSRLQTLDFGNGCSRKVLSQGKVLPYDVAITEDGTMVVTDHRERTLKGLRENGEFAFSWQRNMFQWPNGVALTDGGSYVVADFSKGEVVVCDELGHEITSFATSTRQQAQSYPDRVSVDSRRRIIVSDAFNSEVKIFSQSGLLLTTCGDCEGPGKLLTPRGVATDNNDNVLVADWDGHAVKQYDSSGRWIQDLVTAQDGIRHPFGLTLHRDTFSLVLTEHKLNSAPFLKMFSCT